MMRLKGFTMMELLVSMAIVGILATVAIPTYLNSTRSAYYTELVQATLPYKQGVGECVKANMSLEGCSGGANGIPKNITTPFSGIASLSVTNGVIRVVPVAKHGLESSDDYILTPQIQPESGLLGWQSSGGAVAKGYVK